MLLLRKQSFFNTIFVTIVRFFPPCQGMGFAFPLAGGNAFFALPTGFFALPAAFFALPARDGKRFFALRGRSPISREKWGKELRYDGGWAAVRFYGGQRVGSWMVAR